MKNVFFIFLWIALAIPASALARTDSVQQAVERFADDPIFKHASLSVAISCIENDSIIAAYHPDLSCITASTMKTVTSSAALQLLGPDYEFVTHVNLVGEISGKKFKGDVIVAGAGDPTLGSAFFPGNPDIVQEVIGALQARGIKKVEGQIVIDNSLIPFPAYNSWWDVGDLAWDYGMGIHGLNYSDNRCRLKFKAAHGQISNYSFTPAIPGLQLVNRLDTVNRDEVNMYLEYGNPAVVVTGSAQAGLDYDMLIANPMPGVVLRDSIAHALKSHDIKYKKKDNALAKVKHPETTLLVEHHSQPLNEIVASLLDRSDNMFAEGLLRAIAHHSGREATAAQGAAIIDSLWQACGLDTSPLVQYDGSGLARSNKASARFLVQMLNFMGNIPGKDIHLHQLMPTAFRRVGPLLQKHALDKDIVLKSGSMTGVQCFVGYYPAYAPKYSFAVLVNGWNGVRSSVKDKISTMLIEIFR